MVRNLFGMCGELFSFTSTMDRVSKIPARVAFADDADH